MTYGFSGNNNIFEAKIGLSNIEKYRPQKSTEISAQSVVTEQSINIEFLKTRNDFLKYILNQKDLNKTDPNSSEIRMKFGNNFEKNPKPKFCSENCLKCEVTPAFSVTQMTELAKIGKINIF